MNDNSSRVMEVDINEILPNRFQPRIQFDEEEILELSDSIKEHGVIQPIVVRTIGDKYEIIAGERRYKASVLAGKETVPVIVKNLNDRDSAEIALIENVQRKNLTPIEEALSYKKILDMGYMTQEALATKLGKSQSSVANKIRLLNLSDDVQEALLENKISERHARSLLRLETSESQNKMLKRIISERLTVRKTDEEIDKMRNESSDDDNSDNSQKVIEKGEINMNDNINMMPNMTSNPTPTGNFDIFGSAEPSQQSNPFASTSVQTSYDMGNNAMNLNPQPINPVLSAVEPQPVNPVTETFGVSQTPMTPEPQQSNAPLFGFNQFDLNTPVTPVEQVPSMSETPAMPEMPAMGSIQLDSNGAIMDSSFSNPTPVQEMPQFTPVIPVAPIDSQVNPQPSSTGFQFDTNGIVTGTQTPALEQPIGVPMTSPIVENPFPEQPVVESMPTVPEFNNTFNFETPSDLTQNNTQMNSMDYTQPEEIKIPEPIIITDYNKQYDPIMPQTQEITQPVVDFKEVINAIRECSNKIEQYGFKIDLEEYDLANMYQVIFKIEK